MLSVLFAGCTVRSWAAKTLDPGDRRKSAPSVTVAEEYRRKALLTYPVTGTVARLFARSFPILLANVRGLNYLCVSDHYFFKHK